MGKNQEEHEQEKESEHSERPSAKKAYESDDSDGVDNTSEKCSVVKLANGKEAKIYGDAGVANFVLTDPEGNTYHVERLIPFCKKHNLLSSEIYKVCTGRFRQHRGWTCQRSINSVSSAEKDRRCGSRAMKRAMAAMEAQKLFQSTLHQQPYMGAYGQVPTVLSPMESPPPMGAGPLPYYVEPYGHPAGWGYDGFGAGKEVGNAKQLANGSYGLPQRQPVHQGGRQGEISDRLTATRMMTARRMQELPLSPPPQDGNVEVHQRQRLVQAPGGYSQNYSSYPTQPAQVDYRYQQELEAMKAAEARAARQRVMESAAQVQAEAKRVRDVSGLSPRASYQAQALSYPSSMPARPYLGGQGMPQLPPHMYRQGGGMVQSVQPPYYGYAMPISQPQPGPSNLKRAWPSSDPSMAIVASAKRAKN
mmetsp:Transcript_47456/g.122836  ORF Transcript_47456/g.122836 Transcript_47456/m.122836 type:complete len:419 (+) Transcript_47456:211-1467(+)